MKFTEIPLLFSRGLLFWFCLAVLIFLVLPPFAAILVTSLSGEGSAAGTFTLKHFQSIRTLGTVRIYVNTFIFALGSSIVSVGLGTVCAWFTERTDAPFRELVYLMAYCNFAIPIIAKVIAWVILLGPKAGLINVTLIKYLGLKGPLFNIFSLPGMIMVQGLMWTPMAFLMMAAPFRAMDPALEEAAKMSGAKGWTTFMRVTLPLASPALLAIMLLATIWAIEGFEVPAVLGLPSNINVITSKIYLDITSGFIPRYGSASANGIMLAILVGLALFSYQRLLRNTRRFATITGKGFQPQRVRLGRWRWAGGLVNLTLPAILILPVLALLWTSLQPYVRPLSWDSIKAISLGNYYSAYSLNRVVVATRNTIITSVTSATIVVLVCLMAAWVTLRTVSRSRWILDQIATMPLAVPAIVFGLAVFLAYIKTPLYGTLGLLIVAYSARYLPLGMRLVTSSLISVHNELEESAMMSGANWFQIMRKIIIPLIIPSLVSAWLYVFLITIRELAMAMLLYAPGKQVLSVTIWELWNDGRIGELAAFVIPFIIGAGVLAVLLRRFVAEDQFLV